MSKSTSKEGLKQVIGVSSLTLSIISGVIGAGIFVLPAIVSMRIGAFGVIGYLFCGIMMASIMLCYAEIGSRISSSGGSYAYVEAAFGKFPAYIINWLYFFGWGILGSAALMNIISDSLSNLLPVFLNPVPRALLTLLLISFMIFLNIRGAKQSTRLVAAITVIKLLPLLCIIIFGFGLVDSSNLHWVQTPALKSFGNTMLILFFAFAGFETMLGASGEIINPRKTVPYSIGLAGLVVLPVYMLLQTVVQGVLGSEIELFKAAPLAEVATRIIGPPGGTILLLCAAVSCFGLVHMDILATPRSLFAGANDGSFPAFLGRVHPKFATPHVAIITYGGLIFIVTVAGGFQQLAVLASAAILLVYLAVICATIKLRKKNKKEPDGLFRAPGGFITPAIGIAAIIWLLSSLSLREILSSLIFISIVCLIFLLTRYLRTKFIASRRYADPPSILKPKT